MLFPCLSYRHRSMAWSRANLSQTPRVLGSSSQGFRVTSPPGLCWEHWEEASLFSNHFCLGHYNVVLRLNLYASISVLSISSSSGGPSGSPHKARPTRQAFPSSEKCAQITRFQPWGYQHSTPKHTRTWETGLADFHKAQHILST